MFLGIRLIAPPATLKFVVPKEEAKFWRPLVEQFNDQNRIRIKLANLDPTQPINPDNTEAVKEAYIAALEAETPYDLIYMDIIWVPEFAEAGMLVDLSKDFLPEDLKREFLVSEVDNGIYQDKLYRVPFRTDIGVLYYRKDLLEQAQKDPPETFKDLINISRELQMQEDIPSDYLWQGKPSESLVAMFVEVLHGFGGYWINWDGEEFQVGLDQDEAINAVKFLLQTVKEGISPRHINDLRELDTLDLFQRGQAVFMRHWPYAWNLSHGPDADAIRGKIGIIPMVHAEGETSGGCKGGWGFGIAKQTRYKQDAIKAVKFFASAAAQRQFTLSFGSVPSRRRLFFDPQIVARYNHYPDLLNLMDSGSWISRPRIPEYAQVSCILQEHLGKVLNPDQNGPTPKAAMTKAAEETRQLLADKQDSECEISSEN
ncbi:MAG: extracellular solute-binding protein [Pseudanabaenales cyanobacterium]|nr:extracellular solute-binding protein [Pseudanabaenales cyanobacterium]